jgi:hypothetical protein
VLPGLDWAEAPPGKVVRLGVIAAISAKFDPAELNLKAAKTLELTLPPSLLLRADRTVE